MKKILITGGNGQLASCLKAIQSNYPSFEFIFIDKQELDITSFDSLFHYFNRIKSIDLVINCAAYTAVDLAEANKEMAWNVNVLGSKNLAIVCSQFTCPLIHISTDYVYDNGSQIPLKETAPCSPKSVYAVTKFEGEQVALYYHAMTTIIRTSWVYSEFGQNFVKTIFKLTNEKPSLQVVNDQLGAPTYAMDLAKALMHITEKIIFDPKPSYYGIFNYSNIGLISWYDFAVEINTYSLGECKVSPIPTSSFPRPASRPAYSVFDLTKIQSVFGLSIPFWNESLQSCMPKILTGSK